MISLVAVRDGQKDFHIQTKTVSILGQEEITDKLFLQARRLSW
jgi:hypothetical protein